MYQIIIYNKEQVAVEIIKIKTKKLLLETEKILSKKGVNYDVKKIR